MGQMMAAVGLIAQVGGTATEVLGAKYEGEAEHAAAIYNARTATQQAREESESTRTQGRRVQSLNITRIAKSGVRLEGSPLEVLAANAYRTEKQALNQVRTGEAVNRLYRMQARQAIVASRFKMAQAVFRGFGSAAGGSAQGFAFGGSGGGAGAGGAGGAAPVAAA